MRIALAADHRGFELKQLLAQSLVSQGHEIEDVGARTFDVHDDYPDFAYPAAMLVSTGETERGILICGSGAGMVIAANKVPGVRAVEAQTVEHIKAARRDDDANVLVLAADEIRVTDAQNVAEAFLNTEFVSNERHNRRLDEIERIEHDAVRPTDYE